jgi:hypothetical protein
MSDSEFETGEGSVSANRDPSSGTDFVRATFSHKGRRKKGARSFRFHFSNSRCLPGLMVRDGATRLLTMRV